MKKNIIISFLFLFLFSCSNKKQIIYLDDLSKNNLNKINYSLINDKIEIGDILKIDISTDFPEASLPYNKISKINSQPSADLLIIDGYVVENNSSIYFPVVGEISTANLSVFELSNKIKQLLIDGGHLKNPYVSVRRVNSKFTVLGEVNNPGTFSFYDKNINLFQALGYSGDLLITANRKITLIREENGLRKSYEFSLTDSEIINKPYYIIKNNDIIIVAPNFSKVKSAGFIGSPSSIASISSLLLSITLLILNK